MLNQTVSSIVRQHWRAVLVGTASAMLSACVGGGNKSSSSEAQSSSIAQESSSSVIEQSSSVESSSVEVSSSSQVIIPSSSSEASSSSVDSSSVSSSEIASSSEQACDEPDTAQFDTGKAIYDEGCLFCHGDVGDGVTLGAAVAGIDVANAPYGKTNDPSLGGYIASGMNQHFKAECTGTDAECAEDVEHYLLVATGQIAVAQPFCESSSSEASSSSEDMSSSVASSSSSPAADITRPGYTVEEMATCTNNVNAADGVVLLGGNTGSLAQGGFSKDFSGSEYNNLALGSSSPLYETQNISLTGDDSCGGVNTWTGVLLKKYANWDGQHSNGLQTLHSKSFSDIQSVVIEMKVNSDNTVIASQAALDAAYGDSVSPISSLDRGNAAFAVMLANNTDDPNGVNAEKYFEVTPAEFDKWLKITIPLNQMDIIKYANYGKTLGAQADLNGEVLTKVFFNPETRGSRENPLNYGDVVRNFISDTWVDSNPPAEILKEMAVSIKKFEIVYGDGDSGSSSSDTSSSSDVGSSSSAAGTPSLSCDISVGQDGGYYTEFLPVTITNSGAGTVANWSVDIDLGAAPSQAVASDNAVGVDSVTNEGAILTISGASLAPNGSASVNVRMNFQNHKVGSPSCIGEGGDNGGDSSSSSSSVAPPPPLVGTGPVANGLCSANTGIGVGSATYGYSYAVLADGSAVRVKGGTASSLNLSGAAIAVTNGGYGGQVCVALASGAVECGQDGTVNSESMPAGSDIIHLTTGSGIGGSYCALSEAGDITCSDGADGNFGGVAPYSHVACGRVGCCAIDSNDEVHCSTNSPSAQRSEKALIVGAMDGGYCGIYDDGRSYCWGSAFAGGLGDSPQQTNPTAPTGFTQTTPVVSYAGGQFTSCWVQADGGVTCSGNGGGTSNGAGGGSDSPTTIQDASGAALTNMLSVSGGRGAACGADKSGDLYCWGDAGGNGAAAVKIDLGGKKVRMPADCMN